MWATHPQMAKQWEAHTPKNKSLPKKVGKKMTAKKPKLGSGKRFAEVEKDAKKSGAKNPAAVAAAAGIKKYGVKKMEKMAQKGKK